MLMTPITPKVMARPMAASSSTEPSDSPYQAFCTVFQIAKVLWILPLAAATAACTCGDWFAATLSRRLSASWSPRSRITAMAAILSVSLDFPSVSTMAACASLIAFLTRGSFSAASALSRAASALASRDLKTACAAS